MACTWKGGSNLEPFSHIWRWGLIAQFLVRPALRRTIEQRRAGLALAPDLDAITDTG